MLVSGVAVLGTRGTRMNILSEKKKLVFIINFKLVNQRKGHSINDYELF